MRVESNTVAEKGREFVLATVGAAAIVRKQGEKLVANFLDETTQLRNRATKLATNVVGDVQEQANGVLAQVKSAAAAKAQFAIGQLYEGKKKSKEAITAYQKLVRDQPGSGQAPEALFRVGVILTAEADRGNQNQANLDLAREAFNDYLLQYPGHSRNAEARKFLSGVGGRDLQRSYDIAEFYEKTGKTESAKVYYRDIVTRSKSGPLHDKARARLRQLGE